MTWQSFHSFGGVYLLAALWEKLHFQRILASRLAYPQFSSPVAQATLAMVANRCLAPASKLAVSESVEKDVYLRNLPKIDVQLFYWAMDFLLEHQQEFIANASILGVASLK